MQEKCKKYKIICIYAKNVVPLHKIVIVWEHKLNH